MNHCGIGSENLLSLRENVLLKSGYHYTASVSHITIDLSEGRIRQLKGKSNSKPKKEYFPYIVDLLLNYDGIKDYKTFDFSLKDLDVDDIIKIYHKKPEILGKDTIYKLKDEGVIPFIERNRHLNLFIKNDEIKYYVKGDYSLETCHVFDTDFRHRDQVTFFEALRSYNMEAFMETKCFDHDWIYYMFEYATYESIDMIFGFLKQKGFDKDHYNSLLGKYDYAEYLNSFDEDNSVKNSIFTAYFNIYRTYIDERLKIVLSEYGEIKRFNMSGIEIEIDDVEKLRIDDITESTLEQIYLRNHENTTDYFYELCGSNYIKKPFVTRKPNEDLKNYTDEFNKILLQELSKKG
jgi:hypothetical protein